MSEATNSRRSKSSLVIWATIGVIAATAIVVVVFANAGWIEGKTAQSPNGDNPPRGSPGDDPPDVNGSPAGTSSSIGGSVISVETIHPKKNSRGFVHSVTQPAYVEGVYTADLMARVPGVVKKIPKNIGDSITEGEVLVELDAPDLVKELSERTAAVYHAEQDVKAAQTNLGVAEACAKTAQSLIKENEAAEDRALALEKFHAEEFDRYKVLAQRDAVVANVLSEKLRDLEAAQADYRTAKAATETAQAKAVEFLAKVDAARVDIDVKKARTRVAEAERDYAQSMVDYTKIRAPFDGVIVSRKVDPGSFVQNASTGNPTPMLRVVKTDWVTFVAWVPEKEAPFVNKDTQVTIRLDALGDEAIRTKVTRSSHWLDPDKSRDLRVEVDLENKLGRLTPGMYGSMTLLLQDFSRSLLVPAGTVFAQGDQTYLYEVTGGHAIKVPVRVQFEDGVQAKIVKTVQSIDPTTHTPIEKFQELSDKDEIVRSGQGELADGQPVKAVLVDR
jgi:RND family efflux transporter MFP subunit